MRHRRRAAVYGYFAAESCRQEWRPDRGTGIVIRHATDREPETGRSPLRVLLVEDSDDDALLIGERLREHYVTEVHQVADRAGMAAALADGAWDVVISDHNLPGFSAIEALRLVTDNDLDIPFIIVSGTIGEALAVEAMKAGAHDFLMKDALAKLNPAVEHAVTAGQIRRMHRHTLDELRDSRERLRQLAFHLEKVREEERASLAREIHDELGGILTALKMDISWLRRREEMAEPRMHEKLGAMTALLDSAIRSMRHIITELRPAILDDLGLLAAVEWQLNEFRKRTRLRTELAVDWRVETVALALPPEHAVAAFRILQESLTNIARHADARCVTVAVGIDTGALVLRIEDDGRGIEPVPWEKPGSYGVLGMRERAINLGGSLEVSGGPGGTSIVLQLPLPHGVGG